MAGKRGGRRPGAGRPPGTGKYGEPTRAVRLPARMVDHLPTLVSAWLSRVQEASPEEVTRGLAEELQFAGRVVERSRVPLPFYDSPAAAGWHAIAEDTINQESVDLNAHLCSHPQSAFLVRVTGDSMINAGIHPGDLLVIDSQEEANDGQIVLAMVDGLVTVKRLRIAANGQLSLVPENADYGITVIEDGMSFHLYGVVRGVTRRL